MFKRSNHLSLLAVVALTLSVSACGGDSQNLAAPSPSTTSQAATTAAVDGTKAFVEAVRDRVPTINSRTDAQIARLGETICVDPKTTGRSAADADALNRSMLVLGDHARTDAEAAIIVGLAKQHKCRPV